MCIRYAIATLFALMYFSLPSEANAQTLLERLRSILHFDRNAPIELTIQPLNYEPMIVEMVELTMLELAPLPVVEPPPANPIVLNLQESSDSQDWATINNWLLSGLPAGTQSPDPELDLERLHVDREQFLCLATNIYFEARGSTENDQRAVALVTLNRTQHWRWAGSICDVVWESYQFSWTITANQPRNRVRTLTSWVESQRIAYEVLRGEIEDITAGATNYYNPAVVNPPWARMAVQSRRIGAHRYLTLTTTRSYTPPEGNTWTPRRIYARTIDRIERLMAGRG